MTWLLTGGAGYIGAHVIRSLQASGRSVVVYDDLSTGVEDKVPEGVPLIRAHMNDRSTLTAAMRDHEVVGVVHLAAKKAVGQSVEQPIHYYRENVDGTLSLVEAARDAGVRRIVYSSSAAVYGAPDVRLISEDVSGSPINPYGETKLVGEWILRAAAPVHGLCVIALRYFNVAGAGSDLLGDTGAHNLIPLVLRAYSSGQPPVVFGDDYPTPDGTCIRDYIHVTDLANAHASAADALSDASSGFRAYNIGRGVGSSVREVVAAVGRAIGEELHTVVGPRRPGDPAALVGAVDRVRDELGWQATRDLDDMARSAWAAWQARPAR